MNVDKFLDDLNTKQHKAVIAPRQPILMLAGPGTGKTRTIIARILYNIEHHHIPPEQILVLTFSNKAAMEIKQRLYTILPEKAEHIRSGTFHSVCLDILRKYPDESGLQRHFSICDDAYQVRLLTHLLKERIHDNPEKKARGILLAFSNYALKNKPLPAFSNTIYELYLKHLMQHNLIDFNQVLTKTYQLFKENRDILDQYRFMNESVLVDEFQDTDPVQYAIVKQLTEKHRNIFVVADDDQSIYAWRGAQPENIRQYMEDFLIETPIFLDINYRSGQSIMDMAQAIVAGTERIEPQKSLNGDAEKEAKLKTLTFSDESKEIKFILNKITDWQHTEQVALEDIALIYPRHQFAEKIVPFFLREKIPFQQASGKNLTEHPVMKTILLYLKLIHDPSDTLILEDLLQLELGYHIYKQIQDLAKVNKMSFRKALNEVTSRSEISYQNRNKVSTFIGNVANLVNLKSFFNFEQLLQEIIKAIENLKPGVLEHNASRLKKVPFKVCSRLKKETTKIWIYHSDPKILFIATRLLEQVFGNRVYVLEPQKIIHVAKNDFVLLLEASPTDDLPCPYETLFLETTDRRRGLIGTLFRWIQVQFQNENSMFKDYVVFDLETTGKNPDTCGIVEIAAIRVENGEIVETFQSLVNPGMPIEKEAQKVHHISQADIEQSPKTKDIWADFIKFIGQDLLIAHNGYGFDFKIIDQVSKELGYPRFTNIRYDSLILARNLFPGKQNSIDALADRYKLDAGTRHRALDDVKVLHEIFQNLIKVKNERHTRTVAEESTEFVALANMIENQLSAVEDKILFNAGIARLQSPYSLIRKKYAQQFSINEQELETNLSRIASRIGINDSSYQTEEHFFQQVLSTAQQFNHLPVDQAIAEMLSYIALINPQDSLSKIDAISLLTFHAAKGLEFEKVIILGMEDGNMPSYFASKKDDQDDRPVYKKMEEQKRLLYVGVTRAKSEVIFTTVRNRNGRRQQLSPFLEEIKDKLESA